MSDSSQRFIARNRAPRVQIEYDVELYGSQKKVQLPFVMGVMSDLAGKSHVAQPPVANRKFLEIDVDNFDERMKAMAPRVAFTVPNTLTGEGNLEVDLTFEKMSDFSPAAIAAKVEPLRPLLEARTQLANLMAYMDGKSGAEALIEKILAEPSLLAALSGSGGTGEDHATALDSLRDLSVAAVTPTDESGAVLDSLRDAAPEDIPEEDVSSDVLDAMKAAAPDPEAPEDDAGDVLGALRDASRPEADPEDSAGAVLDGLRDAAPEDIPEEDVSTDILDALRDAPAEESAETDESGTVLDDLRAGAPAGVEQDDSTDDLLADLAADAPDEAPAEDDAAAALDSLASADVPEETGDGTDDLLADLAADAPDEAPAEDDAAAALDSLASADLPETAEDDTDDLLAELAADAPEDADAPSDLDALLGDLGGDDTVAGAAESPERDGSDLDALLDDLGGGAPDPDAVADEGEAEPAGLTNLDADQPNAPEETADMAATGDLDDLLGDLGADEAGLDEADDLDASPGDLGEDPAPDGDAPDLADTGDLDDLLGDLGVEETSQPEGTEENLDALLGDLGSEDPAPGDAPEAGAALTGDPEFAYGTLGADRPAPERLNRKRFRLAILGDFSGRAARGLIETGDALAARRATLLDPDTVEDIIESFATDLVLPIGKDGAGVAVPLKGLDDLHPDELYENVELFSELVGLRQQLQNGATAEHAAKTLMAWGEKHGKRARPPKRRSGGNAIPADRRLSAFEQLMHNTERAVREASPVHELLERVVGPHIRALPDPEAGAMIAAVDAALSDAMRMLLHHPEFQSLEAQWRALDLIARSIETDDSLDVMLYDISAEEIAADLAAHDDLSQSGLARLFTEEPLDAETGRGGYSALIGLYTFEETPPHAELLGRIARVAAHVDAPFLAAISPAFLEIEKQDRHPQVAKTWDTLRAMPEAGHLGLLTPRFLLRRPYGAKTEPIDAFEFEEFTMQAGLSGLLWANPAVLAAILLAQSFRRNGPSMDLGSVMSLGGMPYHYVTDRHGDQVALPCTERNLTQSRVEFAMSRGFMPVVSIKGRDEVRLASFQSLAGGDILGPWTGVAPPDPSPPDPAPPTEGGTPGDSDAASGDDTPGADDLDDLLSGFGDDPDGDEDDGGEGDIEADLAALLDDL